MVIFAFWSDETCYFANVSDGIRVDCDFLSDETCYFANVSDGIRIISNFSTDEIR